MGKSKEELRNSPKVRQFLSASCDNSTGFGVHQPLAVELLRSTTSMLDQWGLNYFLISGTLLGHIRHDGFIPWDDDIDILVDKRIYDVLPEIKEKHEDFRFICCDYKVYLKASSRQHGMAIPGQRGLKYDHCLYKWVRSYWPFVDIFVYDEEKDGNLKFFHKTWDRDKFLPTKRVQFLGMEVSIPADPHHFLMENFGPDYMTRFVRHPYSHRLEQYVGNEDGIA